MSTTSAEFNVMSFEKGHSYHVCPCCDGKNVSEIVFSNYCEDCDLTIPIILKEDKNGTWF